MDRKVRLLGSAVWPIGVEVEPYGQRAFLANTGDGRLAVIDLGQTEIVGMVAVGREPGGMALAFPVVTLMSIAVLCLPATAGPRRL